MKQVKMFRLDSDSIEALTNLSNMTSLNQTEIMQNALKLHYAIFLAMNSAALQGLIPAIQSKKEVVVKENVSEGVEHGKQ